MAWNPSVVSGIGVPNDMGDVYRDMHSYLATCGALMCWMASGLSCQPGLCPWSTGNGHAA